MTEAEANAILLAIKDGNGAENLARILNERLAAVEALVEALGDPTDPRFLHPQTASLLVQIRAALHPDPSEGDTDA